MSETTTSRTNQSATTATLAGYEIPRLGMGTMALAIEGRPSNRDQAIETIHAALDAGVRYLDTAWSYYLPSAPGTGEPEDMGYGEYLVRDALHSWHGPKDQVLVATKTGWLRTLDGNGNYGWQADARPETMIANAKESARRLGVDTLDLLYSHCNDPQVPYEDQMGALKQLVDEGVAKAVGISRIDNADIETARNILGDRLVAVQNQFSPVHRDPEHTLETCEKLGLAFVLLVATRRIPRPVQRASVRPVPRSRQDSRLLLPARHARVGTCAIPISVHDSLGQKPAGDSGLVQSQRTEIVRQ